MKSTFKARFVVAFLSIFFVFTLSTSADTLGQGKRFFISPQYDDQSRTYVNATLRYISAHVYFYVENNYWNGISDIQRSQSMLQIEKLADEFDKRIYPIETEFFGSEPNPGIDRDVRITILLTPLVESAGGYFDTANQYPVTEAPNSNELEIIYLNVEELADQEKMFAFLAHEFQHLISFNQKEKLRNISDDIWLNELRSEYAVTLLGYNDVYEDSHLQRRVRAFTSDPSDSLTEWKNLATDYGQIGLFGEYIAEHFSPQVIADTLKNRSAGFNSLAESLTANGRQETFLDIYRDWLVTNFLNDMPSSSSNKFGYSRKDLNDLRVTPTRTVVDLNDDAVIVFSDSIKDWQGKWYDISKLQNRSDNILKISFDSPSLASFYISYLLFSPDGSHQLYEFKPLPGSASLYIPGIGTDFNRIVIMPIKKDKRSGFLFNETPVTLTTSLERVVSAPSTPVPNPILNQSVPVLVTDYQPETSNQKLVTKLSDGTLIRARDGSKVYVISAKGGSASGGKGGWRRHIIDARIFGFYPGFGFEKVTEVDSAVLGQYQESNLVRLAGGEKVYSVDEAGARHWLNISGEQFSASGRSWDGIFTTNLAELNFYKSGPALFQ